MQRTYLSRPEAADYAAPAGLPFPKPLSRNLPRWAAAPPTAVSAAGLYTPWQT